MEETPLIFEDLTPQCDLDLKNRNPTFPQDTPGHDDAPSYQVWLHTVRWRSSEDIYSGQRCDRRTDGKTDRRTDGQPDSNIPLRIKRNLFGQHAFLKWGAATERPVQAVQGTFDSPGLPPGGFSIYASAVPNCGRQTYRPPAIPQET